MLRSLNLSLVSVVTLGIGLVNIHFGFLNILL